MDWMNGKTAAFAYGAEHGYLVLTSEREVRLCRFSIAAGTEGLTAVTAREAAETTIVFPLGRGPGRPGGQPELEALAVSARGYAERFEAGQDIDGYPHWQRRHAAPERGRRSSRSPPGALRELPGYLVLLTQDKPMR